jgi:hypothetical protein
VLVVFQRGQIAMSRYYFDTYDQDQASKDVEGMECKSKSEIQRYAIDALPEMARDELPDGLNHDFRVEVRDERGRVVFHSSLLLRSQWLEDVSDS